MTHHAPIISIEGTELLLNSVPSAVLRPVVTALFTPAEQKLLRRLIEAFPSYVDARSFSLMSGRGHLLPHSVDRMVLKIRTEWSKSYEDDLILSHGLHGLHGYRVAAVEPTTTPRNGDDFPQSIPPEASIAGRPGQGSGTRFRIVENADEREYIVAGIGRVSDGLKNLVARSSALGLDDEDIAVLFDAIRLLSSVDELVRTNYETPAEATEAHRKGSRWFSTAKERVSTGLLGIVLGVSAISGTVVDVGDIYREVVETRSAQSRLNGALDPVLEDPEKDTPPALVN